VPTLNVLINGKTYRMACDEGEEDHLQRLAERFNGEVEKLKGSFGEIGDQRLTVMAAIITTDEVFNLKERVRILEGQLQETKERDALESREKQSGDDDLAASLAETAQRIEQLATKLTKKA